MNYKNAKTVLPERLLKELQQYVQGEIIYVPGVCTNRAGWGEANGTRQKYAIRNNEIIMMYRDGAGIDEIADNYHLSEYSIRKIISGKTCKIRAYGQTTSMDTNTAYTERMSINTILK